MEDAFIYLFLGILAVVGIFDVSCCHLQELCLNAGVRNIQGTDGNRTQSTQ